MSAWRVRAGVLAAAAVLWLAASMTALADSPAPSQAAIGDPRGGQAAGFAGNPGFAILIVALVAIVAVAGTLAWIRATGGPASGDDTGADTAERAGRRG